MRNTNAHADGHSHSYCNSYGKPDGNCHRHCHCNGHSDGNGNIYAYAYGHSHIYAYPHGHGDIYAYPDSDGDIHAYAYGDSYIYAYRNGYSYSNSQLRPYRRGLHRRHGLGRHRRLVLSIVPDRGTRENELASSQLQIYSKSLTNSGRALYKGVGLHLKVS